MEVLVLQCPHAHRGLGDGVGLAPPPADGGSMVPPQGLQPAHGMSDWAQTACHPKSGTCAAQELTHCKRSKQGLQPAHSGDAVLPQTDDGPMAARSVAQELAQGPAVCEGVGAGTTAGAGAGTDAGAGAVAASDKQPLTS
jgi:hypothetical protein